MIAPPKSVTRPHALRVKADGSAVFHPDFLDDPNNPGLYDRQDEQAGK